MTYQNKIFVSAKMLKMKILENKSFLLIMLVVIKSPNLSKYLQICINGIYLFIDVHKLGLF